VRDFSPSSVHTDVKYLTRTSICAYTLLVDCYALDWLSSPQSCSVVWHCSDVVLWRLGLHNARHLVILRHSTNCQDRSSDDHDTHDFLMIAYIVLNVPWMIGGVLCTPLENHVSKGRRYDAFSEEVPHKANPFTEN